MGSGECAYYAFARQYRQLLARQGFTLELVPGAGSVETLTRLVAGTADVGFVQGGTARAVDASDLTALGGVFDEPVWVIHRRAVQLADLSELRGRRVAVGEPGSGTRLLALQLLSETGLTAVNTTVRELPTRPSSRLPQPASLPHQPADRRGHDRHRAATSRPRTRSCWPRGPAWSCATGSTPTSCARCCWRQPTFPFWLAGILDRLVLIVLPVATLLLPLFGVVLPMVERLRDVRRQAAEMRETPVLLLGELYLLLWHIDRVLERLERRQRPSRASGRLRQKSG
jgi:NMT1 family protein